MKIIRVESHRAAHYIICENKVGQRFKVISDDDTIAAVGDYWTLQPNYRHGEFSDFVLANRVKGFK